MSKFDANIVQSYAKNASDNAPRVAYFYDPDIGSYYYGPGHPMKPQRIRMAHSLILSYDLYKEMDVFRPHDATHVELCEFHDSEYVNFLSEVGLENYKFYSTLINTAANSSAGGVGGGGGGVGGYPTVTSSANARLLNRFNLIDSVDCPVFDGLFEFQASCAGASIDCARELNYKNYDFCINWSGGLHHAKRSEASGFCYINDIVLGILELLKYHTRVLYIDIDVHHGDGVEEAFYLSHRVMTVSLHKYGEFFPGTGDINDVGSGTGKYYALNIPLDDGIDDESYFNLYVEIISKVIEVYQPEAIVLQCGADSITGDRLGTFNMTTKGHGACVQWTKSLRIPTIVLGGGGYTIRNVARAWAYETAVVLGKEIDNKIPVNEYYEYFGPQYNLHLEPDGALGNKNSQEYINSIRVKALKHLSQLEHAPSVQFSHIPADFFSAGQHMEDDADEIEQYHVEWEGGGVVDRAVIMPHMLRSKLAEDRASLQRLEIAKGPTDLIVDGD